jgi:hypothetical protein
VLVRMKCGIHIWEFAFIGVVENPYFAVSGTNGVYALPPDLPAGKYVLEAVHPKAGRLTQDITVADGDRKAVDFVFEVPVKK